MSPITTAESMFTDSPRRAKIELRVAGWIERMNRYPRTVLFEAIAAVASRRSRKDYPVRKNAAAGLHRA
jgi:hypothetical protein